MDDRVTAALADPFDAGTRWSVVVEHEPSQLAFGPGHLRRVTATRSEPFVRIYRPFPVLAFGGSDRPRPGFEAARTAALRHGFVPVQRAPGGHAVAYHTSSLCIEVFAADDQPHRTTHERFRLYGEVLRDALHRVGIDTELGSVPDEYCPGAHSLNHEGTVKLVGTAQRVVRGGWMFGAGLVVADADPVRAVLADVYRCLGLDFDPASVAATTELSTGADETRLITAFVAALGSRFTIDVHDEPTAFPRSA